MNYGHRFRKAFAAVTAGLLGVSAGAAILQGQIGSHDPSRIIRCNGRYYVYSTGANIQMKYSDDLVHWTNGPSVLNANDSVNGVPQWARDASPGNTGNVCWAPDIVYFNGLYHLYWSFSTFGSPNSVIGLLTNPTLNPADAAYKWTDQGMVVQSSTSTGGPNCIDPAPVWDKDGNLWLAYGSYNNYGIGITRLDNTTGLRLSPTSTVTNIATRNIEAAYVVYHDRYYYQFFNAGTCCAGANSTYHIKMGRSVAITGPYVDKTGRSLTNGGGTLFLATSGNLIGPGHAGIFNDGTIERLTYHLESDGTNNGASTLNMQTLLWSADGWPVVGYELPAGTYKVVSKSGGLAMTVHGNSTADGAALDQSVYTGSMFQQWTVSLTTGGTPTTGFDGYYRLTNMGSGQVVDLYYCRSTDGTAIDQYPWFNNNCQRWFIEQTTDGYWRMVSRGGGGVIEAPAEAGGLLTEQTWDGGDGQQWSFVAVNAPLSALKMAGGLSPSTRNDLSTLSAVTAGRISLADAARLLRQANGL